MACARLSACRSKRRRRRSHSWARAYPKMTKPSAKATTSGRPTESRRRCQMARGSASQLSTSGVAMRTPSVSPTHHVHHVMTNSDHGIWPLTARVVTPTVALTRQLSGPPSSRKVHDVAGTGERARKAHPAAHQRGPYQGLQGGSHADTGRDRDGGEQRGRMARVPRRPEIDHK